MHAPWLKSAHPCKIQHQLLVTYKVDKNCSKNNSECPKDLKSFLFGFGSVLY